MSTNSAWARGPEQNTGMRGMFPSEYTSFDASAVPPAKPKEVPPWAGPQYTVPPAAAQTMPQPEAVTEGPAPTPLVTVYPRTAGTAARSGSLGANEPKVPVPLYTYEQYAHCCASPEPMPRTPPWTLASSEPTPRQRSLSAGWNA